MPNWKKFVVKEISGSGNITSLRFDDRIVKNRYWSENLSFFNRHPFNSFLPGDEVEIDVDKVIEFKESVDRWYKETNRGGYDLMLKERINDESIIRPIRCKFQENMALVSRNSNELSIVRSERDSLKTQNYNLQRERDNYQSLVRAGERELTTKNNQIVEKDRQIREKGNQITTYSTQLTTAQNQLRDKEGQLTLSKEEVKRVTDLFNNLQIESNNKDSQIKQKVDELRRKEREIIELKAQLGTLSPEEVLNKKISLKRRELDGFVNSLSFNYETVMNLCNAHERLDLARRRNYDQDNINNARNEIEQLERELYTFVTQNNIAVDDLHEKIYQNCEELAKLRAELERLHEQQYQAQQEVPTNR